MNKALQKTKAAGLALLAFFVSAVLWIVMLFITGAVAIVMGVSILLGPGAAFIAAGVALLCACFLLKRAVTNGQ